MHIIVEGLISLALNDNYSGCTVLIYDENGDYHSTTQVAEHDKSRMLLTPERMPDIHEGVEIRLFILSHPMPCEYKGRIVRIGSRREIALFSGMETEHRQAVRHKVDMTAQIEGITKNGVVVQQGTPIDVHILNISLTGLRMQAAPNNLEQDSEFHLRLRIGDNDQIITAQVLNIRQAEDGHEEYGCRIISVD